MGEATTSIRRLLVANRGEVARRVARTARRLGVEVVAVASDADADAAHAAEADVVVRLPGRTPGDTYLRVDRLVDAARRSGADAVHPGYGFLAESADFARAVEAEGLVWVGPPAEAIAAMGDKHTAGGLAREVGVPLLPRAEVPELSGDEDADARALAALVHEVGIPAIVKASAGGGGRGMRPVTDAADVVAAVTAARREAIGAFGDDRLLLEPLVARPRHVEIQLIVDAYGTACHLFERDCTVQRRYQKMLEEAPSPAVDAGLRDRLGAWAVGLAERVGYRGLGTVEFVVDGRGEVAVTYRWTRTGLEAAVEGHAVSAQGRAVGSGEVEVEVDGIRRRVAVHDRDGEVDTDSALGHLALVPPPRFPDPHERLAAGSLTAPLPGTVAAVPVTEGAQVAGGDPLVVIESMKMEHTVRASRAGRVTALWVQPGAHVDTGEPLLVLDDGQEPRDG
ncbi:biotin/lipoyl-binding protein [Egibacter rhizosphaerae]|uniref:Biotin/lipoyl-binding protein n=1 Tax=Egibacter rhizosphaerae TaxID=1670831 RepID=A0A411YKA5_9ACTN|nr:biotin carboxylase N-terminal domain-containing protein [Egibacter rhizosphaerae]QBI21632.1 biotin/lipoyl-binding protein [Egibacter rhizosphaerae]